MSILHNTLQQTNKNLTESDAEIVLLKMKSKSIFKLKIIVEFNFKLSSMNSEVILLLKL